MADAPVSQFRGLDVPRQVYGKTLSLHVDQLAGEKKQVEPIDYNSLVMPDFKTDGLKVTPHTGFPWEAEKEAKIYNTDTDKLKGKIDFLRAQLDIAPLAISHKWRYFKAATGAPGTPGKYDYNPTGDYVATITQPNVVVPTNASAEDYRAIRNALVAELIKLESEYALITNEQQARTEFKNWVEGKGPNHEYASCFWIKEDDKRLEGKVRSKPGAKLLADNLVTEEEFKRSLIKLNPEFARNGIVFYEDIVNPLQKDLLLQRLSTTVPQTEEEAWLYYWYIVRKMPIEWIVKNMENVIKPTDPENEITEDSLNEEINEINENTNKIAAEQVANDAVDKIDRLKDLSEELDKYEIDANFTGDAADEANATFIHDANEIGEALDSIPSDETATSKQRMALLRGYAHLLSMRENLRTLGDVNEDSTKKAAREKKNAEKKDEKTPDEERELTAAERVHDQLAAKFEEKFEEIDTAEQAKKQSTLEAQRRLRVAKFKHQQAKEKFQRSREFREAKLREVIQPPPVIPKPGGGTFSDEQLKQLLEGKEHIGQAIEELFDKYFDDNSGVYQVPKDDPSIEAAFVRRMMTRLFDKFMFSPERRAEARREMFNSKQGSIETTVAKYKILDNSLEQFFAEKKWLGDNDALKRMVGKVKNTDEVNQIKANVQSVHRQALLSDPNLLNYQHPEGLMNSAVWAAAKKMGPSGLTKYFENTPDDELEKILKNIKQKSMSGSASSSSTTTSTTTSTATGGDSSAPPPPPNTGQPPPNNDDKAPPPNPDKQEDDEDEKSDAGTEATQDEEYASASDGEDDIIDPRQAEFDKIFGIVSNKLPKHFETNKPTTIDAARESLRVATAQSHVRKAMNADNKNLFVTIANNMLGNPAKDGWTNQHTLEALAEAIFTSIDTQKGSTKMKTGVSDNESENELEEESVGVENVNNNNVVIKNQAYYESKNAVINSDADIENIFNEFEAKSRASNLITDENKLLFLKWTRTEYPLEYGKLPDTTTKTDIKKYFGLAFDNAKLDRVKNHDKTKANLSKQQKVVDKQATTASTSSATQSTVDFAAVVEKNNVKDFETSVSENKEAWKQHAIDKKINQALFINDKGKLIVGDLKKALRDHYKIGEKKNKNKNK